MKVLDWSWRVKWVIRVKEKTLRKVEDYFARETAMRGCAEIQVSLDDLRQETQLSLVTIYKAIENLLETGALTVLAKGSRRSPKIYRYSALKEHEAKNLPTTDINGLTIALEKLLNELSTKEKVIEALRNKLAVYEVLETQILYRLRVSEDVEVIVRKKSQ